MNYSQLVETYEKVSSTTKRLDKTYYVSEFLKNSKKDDIDKIILLLQGKVFHPWDKKVIGISTNLVIKAISLATGKTEARIKDKWREMGDLGETAEKLEKTQNTLFRQKLTVSKIFETIKKLASITGKGSTGIKLKLISNLFANAEPKETKYIVRTILEDLRIGVAQGTLRDAITWAFMPKVVGIFYHCPECKKWLPNTQKCINCGAKINNKFKDEVKKFEGNAWKIEKVEELTENQNKVDKYDFILTEDEKEARKIYNFFTEKIQDAYNVTNDFSIVAKAIVEKGINGLKELKLVPEKPIKVMLYQKAKGISDAFKTVGKPAAIEYKYDGFRMQIHKKGAQKSKIPGTTGGNEIKLFTRRLENVTKQFPDVVEHIRRAVKGNEFILDSEIVGLDEKTGKFKSFQQISQRIKRKYDIEKIVKEIPIVVNVFDIVEYEGKNLLKTEFIKRRKIIEEIVKKDEKVKIAQQIITGDEEEANEFYQESLQKGNEGIMIKNLEAEYKPGSRVGYGVKVKPIMETLDLVITGAEWGKGKRSGWLSSFIVSCRDSGTGEFLEIGKFGTGVKELAGEGTTFNELTEMLKPLIISEKGKEVQVKPKMVVEINYEEIQKSPKYSSGYALRFPRFLKLRDDKDTEEASTIDEIEQYYKEQRGRDKQN